MQQQLLSFFNAASGIVWGVPMLILLVGTGIYLTLRLRFVTITKLPHALKLIFAKDDKESEGDVSGFEALATALSSTIGTGNIAGVATAISLGGPGAALWMWVAALFGTATKFAEGVLAVKYRVKNEAGEMSGGPMYYIEKGLGEKWKPLAIFFAFCGILVSWFGIGATVQANSLADALDANFGISTWVSGTIMAVLVGVVVLGGIKRIAKVAGKIVPLMSALYILSIAYILLTNLGELPGAISLIITSAFSGQSAVGGFAGAGVMMAIKRGVSRGVFSNEAGVGSAPIAHASAKTNSPVRQGLIAMTGTFIDTILICTLTTLTIVVTGVWDSGLTGAALTTEAFNVGMPGPGGFLIGIGIIFFAFSTALGWCFYGEKCVEYLFGSKAVKPYKVLYLLCILIGANSKLNLIWAISDVANAMMIIPNLIALLGLSGVIIKTSRKYFDPSLDEDRNLVT
ncbi:alanine/glycine:cation symporter family protein [Sporohalobacter salinus]|uniref:alanine/glycine:cation symporter family protein n=1 Tax=Sporohalobacter salinus TaxID=1494606 RepID=UPI00195F3B48|nr:sodium:alanine symporter family protein [Sporohalobacter salinus]MBM7623909.1 AGCS family alanine or glycine:cation symporter [Sporohalobacter salinus]